jgi:hypothetical protein
MAVIDACTTADHAAALEGMTARDVDLRPFRQACKTLLNDLDRARLAGGDADRITALINTLEGVMEDSGCGQGMVGHF